MAWRKYDVLIHLGADGITVRARVPNHIGIVKARTKDEAEKKGTQIARSRGLCGLIEVVRIIDPN